MDFDYYDAIENNISDIINETNDNQKEEPEVDDKGNKLIKCKFCQSINSIVYDSENYYYICTVCGSVNNEEEIRYEYMSQDKEKIDYTKQIYTKSAISKAFYKSVKSQHIRNIYKWNVVSFKEMEEQKIRKLIYKSCETLNVKKCIADDTIILYKLVVVNHTTKDLKNVETRQVTYRGTNKIGIIGSCIYYACKKNSFNKTIREIAICLHITTKLLNKSCNSFLKSMEAMNYDYDFNVSTPEDYLNTYQILLGIHCEDMKEIRMILENINNCHFFDTKVPHIKALISIITFLKNNDYGITQQKICDSAGISRITLMQLYKERDMLFEELTTGKKSTKYIKPELTVNNSLSSDYEQLEPLIVSFDEIDDKLKEIQKIEVNKYVNNLYLDKIIEFLN